MSRNTQSVGSEYLQESLIKKKAEECVQYILYCYLADRKVIIRRTDLVKNVLKDHSKQFRTVFKLVDEYLNDVFGLSVVALDSDKNEKFGIRRKFEFDFDLNKNYNDSKRLTKFKTDSNENDREFQEQFKYSMLMICLSLILMNENEIDSGLFWDTIKKLDINKEEKRHKYLGDVLKYFTVDLVKEGYLEYEPIKNVEPPTFKFKWGYKSKLEITKMSVLNFVCEIYGGKDACKPEEWIAQFADASKPDDFNSITHTSPSTTQAGTSRANRNNGNEENNSDFDDENHDPAETTQRGSRRNLNNTQRNQQSSQIPSSNEMPATKRRNR